MQATMGPMNRKGFDAALEPALSWRTLGDPSHVRDRWVLTLEARRPDVQVAVLAQALMGSLAITSELILLRVGEAFDTSRPLRAALAQRDAPGGYAGAESGPEQTPVVGKGCSGSAGAERHWAAYLPQTEAQIASAITATSSENCLLFSADGTEASAFCGPIVQGISPANERFALLRAALAAAHPQTLFLKADRQFDDPPAIVVVGPKEVVTEAKARMESGASVDLPADRSPDDEIGARCRDEA